VPLATGGINGESRVTTQLWQEPDMITIDLAGRPVAGPRGGITQVWNT
jgi:hypothetical protein